MNTLTKKNVRYFYKLGMLVHACNSRIWEVRAEESKNSGHSVFHSGLGVSVGYLHSIDYKYLFVRYYDKLTFQGFKLFYACF